MTYQEVDRVCIFKKVADKHISLIKASNELSLSYPQVKRLYRRFKQEGPRGLISRRRGRPSPNRLNEAIKAKALELIRCHYADYGPTLAREKLIEKHSLKIGKETLRQLMIQEGLWKAKRKKERRVFAMRARRSCKGDLVQIDGSYHAWFEDRAEPCCLLVAIDDATSASMGLRFCKSETTQDYLDFLEKYLKEHGRPEAFYSDKHSVFRVNQKGALGVTRFHEILKRLDIELICAHTPQAKGRVERANGVLQDRLVKELRERGITSIASANAYLDEFRREYNEKFAKPALDPSDHHRSLLPSQKCAEALLIREERRLSKELTFDYGGQRYQIETSAPRRLRGQKIEVYEYRGAIKLVKQNSRDLSYHVSEGIKSAAPAVLGAKEVRRMPP